jgi:NTE family protein
MSHTFDQSDLEAIAAIEAFRALSTEDIRKLARIGRFIEVSRGELLVRQGERADALYYVLNGRFAVEVEGRKGAINEIRRGEPIGEIAFFRGGTRTANVRAKRDSLVLAFDQNQMDELSRSAPRFTRSIISSLADRLAHATPRIGDRRLFQPPETIAVVCAGHSAPQPELVRQMAATLGVFGKTILVDAGDVPQRFCPPLVADPHDITGWIEALEDESAFVLVDVTGMDDGLKRHLLPVMDCVLLVADASGSTALSAIEDFVLARCSDCDIRLVLLHATSAPVHVGTAAWLAGRPVSMHHHVARENAADIARLARFLTGNAIGFVASGGGAVCAAQVGVYKTFREQGIGFDIFGGTSAGSAMAAAFAYGLDAEEIDRRIGDIFLTRKAMGRFTIPRYSLFDHHPFDAALRAHFGETCIEDLHLPYFALSTNLSTGEEYVHRTGKVWQAIRASGAIPGLLPPFYTEKGEMLVDGCLLDNVPLRIMHRFSAGSNVVVAFRMASADYFNVKYEELPGRWQLASALPNLLRGGALPNAPGIAEVLTRAITLSPDTELSSSDRDIVIVPPIAQGIGIMSWDRHTELMESACVHTRARLNGLDKEENPALKAIRALQNSR